jgi:hypothetical protein
MAGIKYGYSYRYKKVLTDGIFLMPHGKWVVRVKKINSRKGSYYTSIIQKETKAQAEEFLIEYNKQNQ